MTAADLIDDVVNDAEWARTVRGFLRVAERQAARVDLGDVLDCLDEGRQALAEAIQPIIKDNGPGYAENEAEIARLALTVTESEELTNGKETWTVPKLPYLIDEQLAQARRAALLLGIAVGARIGGAR